MLRGTPNSGVERDRIAPDVSNCEREPIHIPGSIQPHGFLIVLSESDHTILQLSQNVHQLCTVSADEALGQSLSQIVGPDLAQMFAADLAAVPTKARPVFLRSLALKVDGAERTFHAIAHRAEGGVILELEPASANSGADAFTSMHELVDAFTVRIESACTIAELSDIASDEVRRLTDFDRVLIYRFDADGNGTVVGESGNGRLPSYLHHRFPASDIPAQARELYRVNRLRLIPDANYQPVPLVPSLNPTTGAALDMSFSTLRSVSPVHVEYLRNMGTAASMSISILREGTLWGLISCHHSEPKSVSFPARNTCDLFARAFSLRLSALEHTEAYERRIEVRSAFSNLLGAMADRGDVATALAGRADDLHALTAAQGSAILYEDQCLLLGVTPTEAEVRALADWLFQVVGQDVYSSESLSEVCPAAASYKDKASGVLAIAVSKLYPNYVLWFRPEVVQTIPWGGDPNKPVETNDNVTMLHPRLSFATWRETVRDRSLPWRTSEIAGAAELRTAIVETVLRKAEELVQLNAELTRSNRELEAFSYSVSHDLRAPLRHLVGYAELLKESASGKLSAREEQWIATIIDSSEYAGRLVDKLLEYSRLGRAELQVSAVDMNLLVEEIRKDVMRDAEGRRISWVVADLPKVSADLMMLRMAVRDLMSNAVKYTRNEEEAVIEVGARAENGEHVFFVKDNGVGFDMQYAGKLFGVFQRLHRWEDFEGTGIGLANLRRIIERHGGRTWAEGAEGVGATFFFSLPRSI